MTDRHRGSGEAEAEKAKTARGSLEVVLAAGSLIDANGEFIEPRRELKHLNAPKNIPLTAEDFRRYKQRYLNPFQLPGHLRSNSTIKVYLVRVSKRKAVNGKKHAPTPTSEKERAAKNNRAYTYPKYVFTRLPSGKYDIHVETVTAHQCLPDAKVRVGVVSTAKRKRIVIVLSTDTIGDIAHAKGIYVGAAGHSWTREILTEENGTPSPEDVVIGDTWVDSKKHRHHSVRIRPEEKIAYRREFNAHALYTGTFDPDHRYPHPGYDPKTDAGNLHRPPAPKLPTQKSLPTRLAWHPPPLDADFDSNDAKNLPNRWMQQAGKRRSYPVMVNALLWRMEKCDVDTPPTADNIRSYEIRDFGQEIVLQRSAPHERETNKGIIASCMKSSMKAFAAAYSDSTSMDRPAFHRQVVVFNEPLRLDDPSPGKIDIVVKFDYIDEAFRAALDGASKESGRTLLLMNEKRTELDESRTRRYRRLLEKLVRANTELVTTPKITLGIGLQAHFRASQICGKEKPPRKRAKRINAVVRTFGDNLRRLARPLGGKRIPIVLTEMAVGYKKEYEKMIDGETVDGAGPMSKAHKLEQKKIFYELLSEYFSWKLNDEVIFWGCDDAINEPSSKVRFAGDRFGLLFDEHGCKRLPFVRAVAQGLTGILKLEEIGRKPAYFGVLQALIETKSRI